MKQILLSITLLTVLCLMHCTAQDKPNIIFIMADDLGYGDIGPYGQREIKTPNLDRMAREGMRFTRHYAGTSVCAPSRCVLMTGMHTGHSEIRANRESANGQLPLSDSALTVATLLKKQGYRTAMIGKWGMGEPGTTGDPNKHGFDLHYGYTDQVLAHNHFPEFLLRNGKKEKLRNEVRYLDSTAWHKGRGSVSIVRNDFADELFTNEAIRFIDENSKRPFFLYLPYIIPHDNGEADEGNRFEAPSQLSYTKLPWSKDEKDYAASITWLDQYVGRILDHLKKKKIDRNTLVIFTSDNGPVNNTMRFNSSGGLRGIKRDLYEGGIRVPFIAWWPGTIKPGSESDHASAFQDFLPTACELAGVKDIPETDGISFAGTLKGGKQQQHKALYFEIHENGGAQAIIKGEWKAVIRNINTATPALPELYNLEKDPHEANNVAAQYPDIAERLSKSIAEARVPSPVFALYNERN